jgi:hypothetical protein
VWIGNAVSAIPPASLLVFDASILELFFFLFPNFCLLLLRRQKRGVGGAKKITMRNTKRTTRRRQNPVVGKFFCIQT